MNDFRIDRCVLGVVSTNCYIVYRDTEEELKPGVVIDPGDNAPFILNRCRELGVRPQAVLLTHGHFDHILAAEDVRRTFHIPVMASEEEMSLLEEPDMNLTGSFGDDLCLTADRWLRDGETLELMGCRWKVIHTPGHTSGSVCYYIEDEKVLFSGDTDSGPYEGSPSAYHPCQSSYIFVPWCITLSFAKMFAIWRKPSQTHWSTLTHL